MLAKAPGQLGVLGLGLLALGAILLGTGLALGMTSLELASAGDRAHGTVVGNRPALVVEFTPRGRRTPVRVQGVVGYRRAPFEIGERVGVYYAPGDPRIARIATFSEMWSGLVLPGAFGGMAAVCGCGVIAAAVGRRRLRDRLRSTGARWRAEVVAWETVRRSKHTVDCDPVVEARHPSTGAAVRFVGDPLSVPPPLGHPATVYVDERGRYLVDLPAD